MKSETIVSEMNRFIHLATEVLAEWLGKILPKTSEEWWEECVLDSLSHMQREKAIEKGVSKLKDLDMASLLRVADRSWYAMRSVAYLPTRERECIQDMMQVRNNWAHAGATLPGKDVIVRDLEIVRTFFEQQCCDAKLIREVEDFTEKVKVPLSEETTENKTANQFTDGSEGDITEKSMVYLVGDPLVRGIVMNITDLGDTQKYEVFVNGSLRTYYSGQIAACADKTKRKWTGVDDLRSTLAAYLINNPSGRDLYSLNAARIDFVPYQFRPALKTIHADEPRILIADSVGVGKTIEAGLIIKELEARKEIERILIICPKPLVTERKWELEMQRFDETFASVDGPSFREMIVTADVDGEWPIRHSKLIVPYSILDGRTYNGEETKNGKLPGLVDLDPPPHFDLVIIDEAHHIRNGSMEKEKAFEYKCVKYFCDNADAVVMLTATPLQTNSSDLFTLLNLLRPDLFIDMDTFEIMSKPNAYISRCVKAMRRAEDGWQQVVLEQLRELLATQWGENVIAKNPVYASLIDALKKGAITREERVRLISETESLHSFYSVINRTRRKDIQDFCVRRPYTIAVDFTDEQSRLHDELLHFEYEALRMMHGSARNIPFMMTTLKRQAASCIFGIAPRVNELIERRFRQLEGEDGENTDIVVTSAEEEFLISLAVSLLEKAEKLPPKDPKYELMLEVIMEKQSYENNKIIVFSTFRHTLAYLFERLSKTELRVAKIDGSVDDACRRRIRNDFELPKGDQNAIDVLLFTEVGSEGLDYQFCDMMINYDLPWNPMRIEQRIGRIDRKGQKSESVSIYNMITNGTVDADIYYRCLLRIGIFENSIGECEEILGDIATKIEDIVSNSSLTEKERGEKLEQMADNEIREVLERNRLEEEERELFGIDLSEFKMAMEIQSAENPWLSQSNIQLMVFRYLNERLGHADWVEGVGRLKQLRLSASARADLREDLRKLPGGMKDARKAWDDCLKGKIPNPKLTFDGDMADRERDAIFVTPMHPLAKQAAMFFTSTEVSYIQMECFSNKLPQGKFLFCIYAWTYTGIRRQFRLVVVCENDVIGKELPDVIQGSRSMMVGQEVTDQNWDDLEQKHVEMWKAECSAAKNGAKADYSYKMGSVASNHNNMMRSLDQRMRDSYDDRIKRMYAGQMNKATEIFGLKVNELKKQVDQTDIHTVPVAKGVIIVRAEGTELA